MDMTQPQDHPVLKQLKRRTEAMIVLVLASKKHYTDVLHQLFNVNPYPECVLPATMQINLIDCNKDLNRFYIIWEALHKTLFTSTSRVEWDNRVRAHIQKINRRFAPTSREMYKAQAELLCYAKMCFKRIASEPNDSWQWWANEQLQILNQYQFMKISHAEKTVSYTYEGLTYKVVLLPPLTQLQWPAPELEVDDRLEVLSLRGTVMQTYLCIVGVRFDITDPFLPVKSYEDLRRASAAHVDKRVAVLALASTPTQ